MNQLNVFNDLILRMSKRTETFVITFFDVIWEKLTKFSFISIWMVQLLKFIMRKLAILIIAFLFGTNKMIVLNIWWSSFIFIIMIVQACFPFMWFWFIKELRLFGHLRVLNVRISNRKNSPYSKCVKSSVWIKGQ